jgi:hypothetical protein
MELGCMLLSGSERHVGGHGVVQFATVEPTNSTVRHLPLLTKPDWQQTFNTLLFVWRCGAGSCCSALKKALLCCVSKGAEVWVIAELCG